jgi:hypothetical protein
LNFCLENNTVCPIFENKLVFDAIVIRIYLVMMLFRLACNWSDLVCFEIKNHERKRVIQYVTFQHTVFRTVFEENDKISIQYVTYSMSDFSVRLEKGKHFDNLVFHWSAIIL